ncbi:hypothetical protein LshimejAT787_0409570 [Lyophyllum shimeji]|uniref:Uncharacterized protein n=1 Tax=Lyophyllum shimeji TaxID=47721 RepID=A0A9P3PM96_LYOSH|nr:hypothetical protein LshimejAT787_0409570 [Lyophyllum shimeji]
MLVAHDTLQAKWSAGPGILMGASPTWIKYIRRALVQYTYNRATTQLASPVTLPHPASRLVVPPSPILARSGLSRRTRARSATDSEIDSSRSDSHKTRRPKLLLLFVSTAPPDDKAPTSQAQHASFIRSRIRIVPSVSVSAAILFASARADACRNQPSRSQLHFITRAE